MRRDYSPEERAALARLRALNDLIADQAAYLDRLMARRAELERALLTQVGVA